MKPAYIKLALHMSNKLSVQMHNTAPNKCNGLIYFPIANGIYTKMILILGTNFNEKLSIHF